jgi:hypothetical protein
MNAGIIGTKNRPSFNTGTRHHSPPERNTKLIKIELTITDNYTARPIGVADPPVPHSLCSRSTGSCSRYPPSGGCVVS